MIKKILTIAITCFFCFLLITNYVVADSPENVEELRKAEQKARMAEWKVERDSKRAEWAAKREAGKAEKKKDEKKDKGGSDDSSSDDSSSDDSSSDDDSSISLHDPQEENTNARIPIIGRENKNGRISSKMWQQQKD